MDRRKVYPGQEVLEEDVLWTNRFDMLGDAQVLAASMGKTAASGFDCTPGGGLTVSVAAGVLIASSQVDATAYSSLPLDSRVILKAGEVTTPTALNTPAPGTAGQGIIYLVQAQLVESDTDATVLPYFDVTNPDIPWSGPNNDGSANTTTRKVGVSVAVKAGTAAVAGQQTIPAPDAGWVGLWTITVLNGQASIIQSNIKRLNGSPVLVRKVPDIPKPAFAQAFLAGQLL